MNRNLACLAIAALVLAALPLAPSASARPNAPAGLDGVPSVVLDSPCIHIGWVFDELGVPRPPGAVVCRD